MALQNAGCRAGRPNRQTVVGTRRHRNSALQARNIIVQGEIGSYGEGEQFVIFRREIQDKSWNAIAFPQKKQTHRFERFDIRGADFGIYVG